ncbi:MAG: primosomal protein N' [Dehalococcoidia bacterium]
MTTGRPVFAAVAVDGPPVFLNLFSYRIPTGLDVRPGMLVLVPFGARLLRGVVFSLETRPAVSEVRGLLATLGSSPMLSATQLAVAAWIAEQYRCRPFDAARLWLPSDLPATFDPRVIPIDGDAEAGVADRQVLETIQLAGTLDYSTLGAVSLPAIERLADLGLIRLDVGEWRRDRLAGRRARRAPDTQGSSEADGAAAMSIPRPPTAPLALTAEQATAWSKIEPILDSAGSALIFGVTGAGKTELYLRALARTKQRGQQAIVLVPEIALTPLTAARFEERFPGRVAVVHSRLSSRDRLAAWLRAERGDVDVVIGSRSALFAPLPSLGLIVLDEEHDASYKQQDPPRYQARAAALRLGEAVGSAVLLGSATPDVASYFTAERGEIGLVRLTERPTGEQLPDVRIVDLRAELRAGNRGMFSRLLRERLAGALARGEQAILYLNHRGSASVVLCRDCGFTARCPHCDTVLTYHAAAQRLVCHLCNTRRKHPDRCPNCQSRRIRYLGAGTERVVQEVERQFPGARVLRLDRDAGGPASYETILGAFAAREADVLVGTQLVAKGHDLTGVSLVGAVNADIGLYLPDFRAPERVFQQLTQAVGRPGRAGGGEAIIQTYSPDHYVIQSAARHDFLTFYAHEIAHRREQRYPPFSRIARLLVAEFKEPKARAAALALRGRLEEYRRAEGIAIDLIGPAPSYFRQVRGRFRWQIVVRGDDVVPFLAGAPIPPAWQVDVDPVSLL